MCEAQVCIDSSMTHTSMSLSDIMTNAIFVDLKSNRLYDFKIAGNQYNIS